ncbi:hypothetical protein GZ77_09595 [Endozoicomonas montiporae]|uniref:Uncharacterized protein n=2 Tax=Endozoicomonas montiporae TaxID=1027273 RepID=A0A081N800_9GAMM|nr:hypothetical protein [Endozoicomonas montiporae]AMO55554.1 hypothetical protein EZMO1_1365 [Endozoicomonas montiporae CL-33]KEQ14573.1 hypothetical protein GZ77_09595 [Endozoicomonas montiporae]
MKYAKIIIIKLLICTSLISTNAGSYFFKYLSVEEFYEWTEFLAIPGTISETIDYFDNHGVDFTVEITIRHSKEFACFNISTYGLDLHMPENRCISSNNVSNKPLEFIESMTPMVTTLPSFDLSLINGGYGIFNLEASESILIGRPLLTSLKIRSLFSWLPFLNRYFYVRALHNRQVEFISYISRQLSNQLIFRLHQEQIWLNHNSGNQGLMTLYTGYSESLRILFQVLINEQGYIRAFCLNINRTLLSFWRREA